MFDGHYDNWRNIRVAKLVNLLGENWFNGKTVLELASGHGKIGKMFKDKGCIVTCAEGRGEHVDTIKRNYPDMNVELVDQTKPYFLGKYDLVIHWGVLYHLPLEYWKQDLENALKHSDLICLESEVADSDNPYFLIKVGEGGYDQSMYESGVRPSADMVEEYVKSLGYSITRYDDSDLNTTDHIYDWKVENTNTWKSGLRRFWLIKK